MRLTAFASIALLSLSGCAGSVTQTSGTTSGLPPGTYPLASVVIALERGGCDGFCAIYRVELHGDGRIVYQGYGFVAEAGTREANIDSQEIVSLLSHLYEIHFFEMPDLFWTAQVSQVRDGTVMAQESRYGGEYPAVVSVRIGDYEKDMRVSGTGTPDVFKALPQAIDDLAGIDQWVR
jgi:Domain of unknown function (DUF6438)